MKATTCAIWFSILAAPTASASKWDFGNLYLVVPNHYIRIEQRVGVEGGDYGTIISPRDGAFFDIHYSIGGLYSGLGEIGVPDVDDRTKILYYERLFDRDLDSQLYAIQRPDGQIDISMQYPEQGVVFRVRTRSIKNLMKIRQSLLRIRVELKEAG